MTFKGQQKAKKGNLKVLNSSFYIVKIGKFFRRGCKRPSYTNAPSYSFSHKFSFKKGPTTPELP
jgi:hypothetical protein